MPGPVAATLWPWGEPMWEPSLQLRVIEQREREPGNTRPSWSCELYLTQRSLQLRWYTIYNHLTLSVSASQDCVTCNPNLSLLIYIYIYIHTHPMADFSRLVFSSFPPRAVNTHLHSLGFLICLQPQPPPKSLLWGSGDFLLPFPGCPFSPSQPPYSKQASTSPYKFVFLQGPHLGGSWALLDLSLALSLPSL